MDGLNEAARNLIRTKNVPEILDAELSSSCTLVAVGSANVVGVGCLDGAEIKRVYVDPSAQGSGAGRALVAALESEAARQGICEIITESSPSAESFYSSLGFQAIAPVSFKRGDAEFRCVRMSKKLEKEVR
ncbi:GNAT family N-acetyltransferase [Planctomycetota bacterium]